MVDETDPRLDGPVQYVEKDVPGKAWLTEAEIKDCWRTNMLGAADDARLLSSLPAQGATYVRMRERLALAEGACRQMGHWREDSRWIYMAPALANVHEMTGHMIRSHYARPLFLKLEQTLRSIVKQCTELETKATGKVGMILPEPEAPPHRETKPVQILLP